MLLFTHVHDSVTPMQMLLLFRFLHRWYGLVSTLSLDLLLLLPLRSCPRWYGPGEPKKVFVERKTHRESWKVRGAEAVLHARVICQGTGLWDQQQTCQRLLPTLTAAPS
jgi:hypothetical protein